MKTTSLLVEDNDIDEIVRRALRISKELTGEKTLDNPEVLSKKRMELSRLLVIIGQFEARYRYLRDRENTIRKIEYSQSVLKYRESMGTVTEARQLARSDTEETRKRENQFGYEYQQLSNLRKDLQNQLNALAGRVNMLNDQYTRVNYEQGT